MSSVAKTVWKFGYGSNISQEFLRSKKNLNPLDFRRSILRGWSLSFPEGKGIAYVEPSFARLKKCGVGEVHGISTLLSIEEARKLDEQETSYAVEELTVLLYDGSELVVEVYTNRDPLPLDFPEGCCSERYRDILASGAKGMDLNEKWVKKLEQLPVYTPSPETMARRAAVPSPSALPVMTIAELALHNGQRDEHPVWSCVCGYIFEVRPLYRFLAGRDATYRNVLQSRGINLDNNDDGGKSPFPRLSELEATGLEYPMRYLDRFIAQSKAGGPIAVLKEFWEEQEAELEGVFSRNTLSKI